MIGININCKSAPYITMILAGIKTEETRNKPTLDRFIGQRVALVETGNGRAKVRGYATIAGRNDYSTVDAFRAAFHQHWVSPGSAYDIKPDGVKYGYIMTDLEPLPEPIPVLKNITGYVWRDLAPMGI